MQNPMSMKIFKSKESLQHISFNVSKGEHDTQVFYDHLPTNHRQVYYKHANFMPKPKDEVLEYCLSTTKQNSFKFFVCCAINRYT